MSLAAARRKEQYYSPLVKENGMSLAAARRKGPLVKENGMSLAAARRKGQYYSPLVKENGMSLAAARRAVKRSPLPTLSARTGEGCQVVPSLLTWR